MTPTLLLDHDAPIGPDALPADAEVIASYRALGGGQIGSRRGSWQECCRVLDLMASELKRRTDATGAVVVVCIRAPSPVAIRLGVALGNADVRCRFLLDGAWVDAQAEAGAPPFDEGVGLPVLYVGDQERADTEGALRRLLHSAGLPVTPQATLRARAPLTLAELPAAMEQARQWASRLTSAQAGEALFVDAPVPVALAIGSGLPSGLANRIILGDWEDRPRLVNGPDRRGLLAITLPLKTTSPLFLGGTNPNDAAELRPPSIRGALRAWYRMLIGPKAAAAKEGHLFGAAGTGQSKVLVQLDRHVPNGKEPWRAGAMTGRGYFGYPLNMGENKRVSFATGTEVPLRLTFRGAGEAELRALVASAWLWVHLGGLGTRSRRGFGSFTATTWPREGKALPGGPVAIPELPNPREGNTAAECAQIIGRGLKQMQAWGLRPDDAVDAPVYALDFARGARIMVWAPERPFSTWGDALDAIGTRMREFRMQPNADGLPKHFLSMPMRSVPHAPHRAAFGLPLTYRVTGETRELRPRGPGRPGRMPSPLLIHLQQLRSGSIVVVLTRLYGNLPGVDIDVVEKKQAEGFMPADRKNNILDRFLNSLGGVEVRP